MSSEENKPQPTVITLDNTNSIRILVQYIELAQQKGAFILSEAELLKRATDVLINNVHDHEITHASGRQLLIQGIHKGQRHGAYSLNDAALLHKVVQFVSTLDQQPVAPSQPPTQPQVPKEEPTQDDELLDDLADLAEPIPLKPKEV